MNQLAPVVMVVISLVMGGLVPAGVVAALVRSLGEGPLLVRNHKGRLIPPVLGVAWLIWAVGLLAVQVFFDTAMEVGPAEGALTDFIGRIGSTPLALPVYVSPFILVAGCLAFGLIDDAFGAGGPKGFGGHIAALRRGRLTTGLLKMTGIGVLAVFYGAAAASEVLAKSDPDGTRLAGIGWHLVALALAALVIALSANLMNLLDLRPGRALKAYLVAVPAPTALFAIMSVTAYNTDVMPYAADVPGVLLGPWDAAAAAISLVIVFIGPAIAVWSADLGERAMLGDAGANTMGAIVGYLLTATLDLIGLAVFAIVLLGLNVLSERISFSEVIDRVPPLRWFDGLGRLPHVSSEREDEAEGIPPAPSVRYHSDGAIVTKED